MAAKARRVLLAASIEQGDAIVRNDPSMADVLVVTPQHMQGVEGRLISELLVADGAAWLPGYERAYMVLERQRQRYLAAERQVEEA